LPALKFVLKRKKKFSHWLQQLNQENLPVPLFPLVCSTIVLLSAAFFMMSSGFTHKPAYKSSSL
jgi:hypothetical protein